MADVKQTFDFTTLDTTNLDANDNFATTGRWSITNANSWASMSTGVFKSGSASLAFDGSGNNQGGYCSFQPPSAQNAISFGFWFRAPACFLASFTEHDILTVPTQLGNKNIYIKCADQNTVRVHIFNPVDNYSTGTIISTDTWYWITVSYADNNASGMKIRIYDASGTQVGSEETRSTAADLGVIEADIGSLIGGNPIFPITYGASGTRSNSGGATSLTPALPAGIASGDLIWAVCSSKNNAVHSCSTTGWTKYDQQNSGASFTSSLWYCKYTGAETAPVITWAGSVAAGAQTWYIHGADAASPIGAGSVNTGSTATHSTAAVTTTNPFSRVMYVDAAAANTAIAQPTGYTENLDAGSATGGTRNATGGINVSASGGSSGAISVTGAAAAWVQWQVEIKSATTPLFYWDEFKIDWSTATFPLLPDSGTPPATTPHLLTMMGVGG